ncbi:DDRGK domain-containing protein 1 isoform X2 [Osmerus mordax]|uniref:DDRGK domain-containing protein 1 isoform X2 n=1 Tax=Osmerus mordax TaxID=8014 RepID=UPI00350F567A
MDIVLYFVAVAILIVLIVSAVKVRGKTEEDNHEARQEVAAQVVGRLQAEEGSNRLRRRRNLNRMMANRMANSAYREAADNDSPVEVEEEYEEAEQQSQATGKRGAKKQKKLEEKQAKRAQREAELEEREERKRTQELREEERRKEDKKERILEQRQEEEELRAKEEQEKREEEEYLCLKQSFVVEEQGEADELTEQESQNLLQEFIQHIKDCKVVLLEDLASHFGLRTQDAISRLQDLLSDGSITGVIDDRGKFIFITPEEMNVVAQFIRQRGRVSITDLAQASNSLINLIPEIHNTA